MHRQQSNIVMQFDPSYKSTTVGLRPRQDRTETKCNRNQEQARKNGFETKTNMQQNSIRLHFQLSAKRKSSSWLLI